jgi:microcompartment protein CcmK/EutM
VIGNVTLNRVHPTFQGARLKIVMPLALRDLTHATQPEGDSLVVWDDLGAGAGEMVCFSEGGEAVQPFKPDVKPVDAYLSAILDNVNLDRGLVEAMTASLRQ